MNLIQPDGLSVYKRISDKVFRTLHHWKIDDGTVPIRAQYIRVKQVLVHRSKR